MTRKLFIILYFLISLTCSAQSRFEVSGGPNVSTLFDIFSKNGYKSEYNAQIGYDFKFSYRISVDSQDYQFGLCYREKNFKILVSDNVTRSLEYETQQISLSLLLRSKTRDEKKVMFAFLIGPSVNVVVNSNAKGIGQYYTKSVEYDSLNNPVVVDILTNYEATESDNDYISIMVIELVSGVEMDYNLNHKLKLCLGVFCDVSMTPAFKMSENHYTSSLTGSLKFGLKF